MSLLKMISSPYSVLRKYLRVGCHCMLHFSNSIHEVSGSVISSLHSRFNGLKCQFNLGERRGSSSRFCLAKILGVNNEGYLLSIHLKRTW